MFKICSSAHIAAIHCYAYVPTYLAGCLIGTINRKTKRKKAMEMQNKKQELKKHYDNSKFKVFFTEDCENVTQIDFEGEMVYYYVYVTASCGCCSEIVDREIELDRFIEYLSDDDYESLLSELKSA